jgi:MoaA/NifB/PqqE/SkfB family radical SAM enzyme
MAIAVEQRAKFLWLEITGLCQLRCAHCYADSSPQGDHGTMTGEDWRRVIDEAAMMDVKTVQFIGGEPTLHSELPELIHHVHRRGLDVEVYTNLARALPEELWKVFELPDVRLATSYFAADAAMQEGITGGPAGSHRRTRANIIEALRRDIPLRVGVVEIEEGQDVEAAVADLRELGVADVKVDRLRQVGRGVRDQGPNVDQLCGSCASGRLAVLPSGDVLPCVFSRWLTLGNVQHASLAGIAGDAMTLNVRSGLASEFANRAKSGGGKDPKDTGPCPPSFSCPPADDDDGQNPKK